MNKEFDFDPNLVTQFLNQYQDRGMMKWQGFYLSDHTASLKKVDQADSFRLTRRHSEQMEPAEIQIIINDAITKHRAVQVERSIQDNNGYVAPFVEGEIQGFYQDKLMIGNEFISIEDIYTIK